MNFDHVFPIPISTYVVDAEIVKNTTTLVNKFIKDTDFAQPSAPGELLTTFYKDKDFLGKLGDKPLLNYINNACREYLDLIGYDPRCFIEITSWLQYNQPGSYFVRHDHYGALISGVLYLEVPENSGDILFHNPLETRRVSNTFFDRIKKRDTQYNLSHVKYRPIVGEMLIFESWLQHTVQQNNSNGNRISVSFNIWADNDAKG
jgi:uncharacterized protein (TIGR02466 family)